MKCEIHLQEDRKKVLSAITKVKKNDPKFQVFGTASGRFGDILKNSELTDVSGRAIMDSSDKTV